MIQQCKNLYYTRPIITIVTIFIRLYLEIRDIWSPGAGLAGMRDSMAQIRDIPGNPGRVATLVPLSASVRLSSHACRYFT